MPVKVKGTLKLGKKLSKILPDARSIWAKEMKASIVDVIVDKITSGSSPVKGQNRYPKYSDGYSKVKGRKQPVDLVSTGTMLNNMIAKQTNKDTIIIEFKGAESKKLASIHQSKGGKMPQRKILPNTREKFKDSIMKKITALYRAAIKKAIK